MNYFFTISVKDDDEPVVVLNYNSALEAVNAYNRFVDYGSAKESRSIVFYEPNGTIHTKVFNTLTVARKVPALVK
jgi:hypothetical protein